MSTSTGVSICPITETLKNVSTKTKKEKYICGLYHRKIELENGNETYWTPLQSGTC